MENNSNYGGNGGFERKMYDVDLKCSKCGAEIKQLPFEPNADRDVYCRDCHKAMRGERFSR